MEHPENSDSTALDPLLADWLLGLRSQSVEAVIILGPQWLDSGATRRVVAVYPPVLRVAAEALAQSDAFGPAWTASGAPLVAWQHLAKSAFDEGNRWRRLCLGHGFQSLVRVEFGLPGGRAFECFLFSSCAFHDRTDAVGVVWSVMNIWPQLRRSIVEAEGLLSPRERQCLALTFDGRTAREVAERIGCSERTVNYHLANAMAKLGVDNKLAAVQRACWLGAL